MIIYSAEVTGEPKNCYYPFKVMIANKENLAQAVSRDYVCGEYRDNRRSNANFIKSDCLAMDLDNDDSDSSEEWKTLEDVKRAFPEVCFCVHYSRNNMRDKLDGDKLKSARPKFHVLFPLSKEVTSAEEYKLMKQNVLKIFPDFDSNALDAGRFFFGTLEPEVEIISGTKTLTEFLNEYDFSKFEVKEAVKEIAPENNSSEIIPKGTRNSTMYKAATELLCKYQDKNEAYKYFLEKSKNCVPPLDSVELVKIWNNAVNTYNNVQSKSKSTGSFKPEDYSDIGQARVIAREYKNCLRYSTATDFLFYNGSYWESSEIQAQGLAQRLTDNQLKEANYFLGVFSKELDETGARKILNDHGEKDSLKIFDENQSTVYKNYKDMQEYHKYIMSRRNSRYIKSGLEQARTMLSVKVEDLDKNPFLLNTPSATFDLRTGVRQAHNPDDLITQQTSTDPSDAGREIWQSALETFFCGDKDLINYVQEIVGLTAIGKVFVEALFIAYGDGRNGKSTFFNSISKVLGTYSWSMPAEILTLGSGESKKNQKAELRGKRLVISAELEESTRLSTATVKHLCSTDKITAERKYKDPFTFIPSHQLVLYTNHLPRVGSGSDDEGTWRRLKVIPFKSKIEGRNDIKNFSDYLVEKSGGAILSWIIEGAQRIIQKGYHLDVPQVVKEATEDYKRSNDWFSEFLEDSCEVGTGLTAKSGELYSRYCSYCVSNGETPRGTKEFYSSLERAGFTRKKVKDHKEVIGLSLK